MSTLIIVALFITTKVEKECSMHLVYRENIVAWISVENYVSFILGMFKSPK